MPLDEELKHKADEINDLLDKAKTAGYIEQRAYIVQAGAKACRYLRSVARSDHQLWLRFEECFSTPSDPRETTLKILIRDKEHFWDLLGPLLEDLLKAMGVPDAKRTVEKLRLRLDRVAESRGASMFQGRLEHAQNGAKNLRDRICELEEDRERQVRSLRRMAWIAGVAGTAATVLTGIGGSLAFFMRSEEIGLSTAEEAAGALIFNEYVLDLTTDIEETVEWVGGPEDLSENEFEELQTLLTWDDSPEPA